MKKCRIIILLTLIYAGLFGQNFIGGSCRYDYFPTNEVTDEGNLKTEMLVRTVGLAYPFVFKDGDLILITKMEHIDLDINYENNEIEPIMDHLQIYKMKFVMLNKLSQKWKFMGVLTPKLSSDFVDDISEQNLGLEYQAGFHRIFSDKFELGGGVSSLYETTKDHIPLPYVWIDWKPTKKIWLLANLPGMIDFNYKLNDTFNFSTMYNYVYESYHGREDYYYDNNNELIHDPVLRRSGILFSERININLKSWVQLSLEGGYGILQNISFNENDKELYELELEPNHFISATFTLGM